MACSWIVWLVALAVTAEATLYDDDYDTYTKAYDYKNAGTFNDAFSILFRNQLLCDQFDFHRYASQSNRMASSQIEFCNKAFKAIVAGLTRFSRQPKGNRFQQFTI